MEGLNFILVGLFVLYFMGILFTLLLIKKIMKLKTSGWGLLIFSVLSALLTLILFWTDLYLVINFEVLLLYTILVIAAYIVFALFFQPADPVAKEEDAGL